MFTLIILTALVITIGPVVLGVIGAALVGVFATVALILQCLLGLIFYPFFK